MPNLLMDLSLKAGRVSVEPQNYQSVLVESFNVEKREVLEHFDLDEIIYHYEESAILEKIA